MSKITNLENKNEEIIYPITVTDAVVMSDKTTKIEDAIAAKATINVSDTDIGEGATLASGEFMAVYGEGGQVQTAEIADSAVTTAKLANNSVTAAKIGADVAFIDEDGTTTTESPWVGTSMIQDDAVTVDKMISTKTAADANGWVKLQLSSNVNLYMTRKTASFTLAATTWTSSTVQSAPVDLDTSNVFYGVASGKCSDNVINTQYLVQETGAISMQRYNHYSSSITTSYTWNAMIVEVLT